MRKIGSRFLRKPRKTGSGSIWTEPEPAKNRPMARTIAHGFLTLSLISHFLKSAIQIQNGVRLAVNYGLNRVRFPAAVHVDSRIRARVALLALKELSDSVEATYSVTIEREQSEKPACVAEWIVRYYL